MCLCANHYSKYLGKKQRGYVPDLGPFTSSEIGMKGEREGGKERKRRERRRMGRKRTERSKSRGGGDKRKLTWCREMMR